MSDMYRENILEHYKNPQNYGSLINPDVSITDTNPLCGDCLTLDIHCDREGFLTDVAFTAKGCAVSIASASLLTATLRGKNMNDLVKMDYNDVESLFEFKISMGRIKCALLPLGALHKAVRKIQANNHE